MMIPSHLLCPVSTLVYNNGSPARSYDGFPKSDHMSIFAQSVTGENSGN